MCSDDMNGRNGTCIPGGIGPVNWGPGGCRPDPAEVAAAVMEDLVLWDLQDRGDHRDFLGIRDHRAPQEKQEL